MKILAPVFILLTLLAACDKPTPAPAAAAGPVPLAMGAGGESAGMESLEGPGQ